MRRAYSRYVHAALAFALAAPQSPSAWAQAAGSMRIEHLGEAGPGAYLEPVLWQTLAGAEADLDWRLFTNGRDPGVRVIRRSEFERDPRWMLTLRRYWTRMELLRAARARGDEALAEVLRNDFNLDEAGVQEAAGAINSGGVAPGIAWVWWDDLAEGDAAAREQAAWESLSRVPRVTGRFVEEIESLAGAPGLDGAMTFDPAWFNGGSIYGATAEEANAVLRERGEEQRVRTRMRAALEKLYGSERAEEVFGQLMGEIEAFKAAPPAWLAEANRKVERTGSAVDQGDIALITYGDSIAAAEGTPMQALARFGRKYLKGIINSVHILPFFPFDTDRGFSVINYREVDPAQGSWEDVAGLGEDFKLMFDTVANHASLQNPLVQGALVTWALDRRLASGGDGPVYSVPAHVAGSRHFTQQPDATYSVASNLRDGVRDALGEERAAAEAYRDFAIVYPLDEPPSAEDLANVTRPRPNALLTQFWVVADQNGRNARAVFDRPDPEARLLVLDTGWVWTTFSRAPIDGRSDTKQVDLNFGNPAVLLEMARILLFYAQKDAQLIRLDAIGYLWKKFGSASLHEPEVHQLIGVMGDALRLAAPSAVTIAEVNEPQERVAGYLGVEEAPEAAEVYEFGHYPLMVYALLSGDVEAYKNLLSKMRERGMTGKLFIPIAATHDGMGMKPTFEFLNEAQRAWLAGELERRGGRANKGSVAGKEIVYEMCITPFSALAAPEDGEGPEAQVRRHVALVAQGLALPGLPAIYINGLLGMPNNAGELGENRDINREQFDEKQLEGLLEDPESPQAKVYARVRGLMQARREEAAFHPEAPMRVLDKGAGVIAIARDSRDGKEHIVSLVNATDNELTVTVSADDLGANAQAVRDLLSKQSFAFSADGSVEIILQPYQAMWLKAAPAPAVPPALQADEEQAIAAIDDFIAQRKLEWALENTPLAAEATFASIQIEMMLDPEHMRAVHEVLDAAVESGEMDERAATLLRRKIPQSTGAGGLGALMPDWTRGLADNGASVVTVSPIYAMLREGDHLSVRSHILSALRRLGYTPRPVAVTLPNGEVYPTEAWVRLGAEGKPTNVWVDAPEAFDWLYHDPYDGRERATQIAVLNEAAQAVLAQLGAEGAIKEKLVLLENEIYTALPKNREDFRRVYPPEKTALVVVNHSVVGAASPRYAVDAVEGIWPEDPAFDAPGVIETEIENGEEVRYYNMARLHAARAIAEDGIIIGVSSEHTQVLSDHIFTAEEEKARIRYDDNTNGAYRDWQSEEIRALVRRTQLKLLRAGLLEVEDLPSAEAFYAALEKDGALVEEYQHALDQVKLREQERFIAFLKEYLAFYGVTLDWEADITKPAGIYLRRVVPYKAVDALAWILENPQTRAAFLKSGERLVVGGRTFESYGEGQLDRIRALTEKHKELRERVVVLPDYNIDAAHEIFPGANFVLMMAQRYQEAAATSPQKGLLSGAVVAAVRNGAPIDWLVDLVADPAGGNGMWIEYMREMENAYSSDEERRIDEAYKRALRRDFGMSEEQIADRPSAASLLRFFQRLGETWSDDGARRRAQYNALKTGMIAADITLRQARGTLRLVEAQLENANAPEAGRQGAPGKVQFFGLSAEEASRLAGAAPEVQAVVAPSGEDAVADWGAVLGAVAGNGTDAAPETPAIELAAEVIPPDLVQPAAAYIQAWRRANTSA